MSIKEIENKIDQLDLKEASDNTKSKRKRRSFSGRTFKGLASALVLLVGSIFAMGAILGFYVTVDSDVTVDALLTWDSEPAEELTVTENFNALPNETYVFEHWINASSEISAPINVSFTWDAFEEGITAGVYLDEAGTQPIDYMQVALDNKVYTIYEIDPMCQSGVYNCGFVITYEEPN